MKNLKNCLKSTRFLRYTIELELTETALAETENAQATLVKMKEIGYLTSIDDFGSGYSSLSLLNTTQFDILKLDRNFLSETYISRRTRDILTHIVAMAHSLNIQVICEGVETKEQSDFLMSAGCLYAQGFYYSKPISQKEFEEKLSAIETSTNEWVYGYYQAIEADTDSDGNHVVVRNMFESFLNAMYTERDPEKTLSFMTSDIYIYDPSSQSGVLTKKEFGEKLNNELSNNLMPYFYEIERFSQKINPDGSKEVFAILSLHQTHITTDSNISRISISASITCVLDKCFIETLHISYISDMDGNQQLNVFLNEKTSYDMLNEKFPGCIIGCYIEPEYPLFFFNPQLLKLFEFSIDEFREFSKFGIVHLFYQEDRDNLFQTIIQTPENSEFELDLRCVKKNGSLFWVRNRGRRITAKDGRPAILVVLMDITERKNAQEALEFEKNRYQLLVECTDATIYEYDILKDLMLINYKVKTPDGLKPGIMTIPGFCTDIRQNKLIHEDDRDRLALSLQNGKSEGKLELRLAGSLFKDGEYLWYRLNSTVLYDEDGVPIRSLGLLNNIDAEKKKISRLTFEARCDSLTGLYNKASLEYLIREAIRDNERDARHAFMIMDMDNFKKVNDVCGHPYGDVILRGLSEVLKKTFRSDDIIARIGGDEFVVFLKNIKSKDQLQEKAISFFDLLKSDFFFSFISENGRSLCHLASKGTSCEDCKFTFSCSIGISIFDEDGEDFESLYQAADIALYQAKGSGNFRFVFHTPDMETGRDKTRFHTAIDSG
ncbi:MAG: diguanylate cyclase [Flexilinea sp.]